MSATGPAIVVEELTAGYGGRPVLEEVSFTVAQGELFGLLGPNGAGKSTLLRVLTRVIPVTRGRVLLNGRVVQSYTRRELGRTVAVVPQGAHVEVPFTVAEVVLTGRTPHLRPFSLEGPRDVSVARRAMEQTGVLALATRGIHSLSGGERQRTFIARALAQEPEVLLLDEPTAFLDIRHQQDLFAFLHHIRASEGLTVLAALHDINLAAAHCTRIAFLRQGRIVATGPPRDVITRERIRAVYDADVCVDRGALTGVSIVLPAAGQFSDER